MAPPPPRILAIDCATLPASVAVVGGADGVHERIQQDDRRTDAWVGLAVMECLRDAGIGMPHLDGLASSVGPGTFTGIRVGIATALGLAAPRRLPVAGVSTLDALAHLGFRRAAHVAACIDARRGQVYAALYARDEQRNGLPLTTAWGPRVCAPEELEAVLASRPPAPLLLGSGASLLGEQAGGDDRREPPALAAAIGELALRAWGNGIEPAPGWPPPEPAYLRPPDATPPQNPLLRARR